MRLENCPVYTQLQLSAYRREFKNFIVLKRDTRMKLWSNNSVQKGNGGFNPERRLLAAVLQRAITDYLTGDGDLQNSAREWLYESDDVSDEFGFAYICEALDFHNEELRKAVQRQHDDIVAKKECDKAASVAAVAAA